MTPRLGNPASRSIALLLAAVLAAPSVQWCGYTWAQVSPECAIACEVGPGAAACSAASQSCASVAIPECAADPTTSCGGDAEERGGCARAVSATAGEPDGGATSRSGRAWCPADPVSGRPETARDDGAAQHGAMPVPSVTLDSPKPESFGPAPRESFAPPRAEPQRRPPARGPPSI